MICVTKAAVPLFLLVEQNLEKEETKTNQEERLHAN
jgi:hypothetical protein